jgi:DNA polymerase-3 subunit epsilon
MGMASIEERLTAGWRPRAFVALDFETANRNPTSACAVALVRVEGRSVVCRRSMLVRPSTAHFEFTRVHGIRWTDVKDQPIFGCAWRSMISALDGVEFIAAHNASFDQRVLQACCRHCGLQIPTLPFLCTVKLARLLWHVHPTNLPNVCDFLSLELDHHDPLSDAEACAGIVLAAMGLTEKGHKG